MPYTGSYNQALSLQAQVDYWQHLQQMMHSQAVIRAPWMAPAPELSFMEKTMQAYLVIVIKHPTEKQKHDDGATPQIVLQPTAVIAKDDAGAGAKAIALVKPEDRTNEDLLEPVVSPFRRVGQPAAGAAR